VEPAPDRPRSGRTGQPVCRLQDHPAQWFRRRLRARQDFDRHDQGLPGGQWRAGGGVGPCARTGRSAHCHGGERADPRQDGRGDLPYRRHPGSRRTRADALGRARSGSGLRAVSRAASAGAGGAPAGRPGGASFAACARWRTASSARRGRSARAGRRGLRGARRVHQRRGGAQRYRQESLRRCAHRRSAQVDHPVGPCADRERSGLQPGHRKAAAAHDPPRGASRRSGAGRDAGAVPGVLPAVRPARHRCRAARREARPVRSATTGRGPLGRTGPEVRVPGSANPVRPLFPAHRRSSDRAAPGLLHAGRDGTGPERDRPRGACHRVLRAALDLRLHELHPHAVQRRHAALAAVVVLPDHRVRRPGRHLRGHQGERAAGQVRRRSGQRLDAGARAGQPHQGNQRQEPGRRAVPEGRQRHRGRGQSGWQAQGRGVRVPRDLAHGHRGVSRPAQEHR
jgi:hypothetical protein